MRLFIGIEFPRKIVDDLCSLQCDLRAMIQRGRFTARENLHLTLQFLGETPENRIEEINRELATVALQHCSFQLSLGGRLGYFGSANPVRVIWLGMQGELTALFNLQAGVAAALRGLGFVDEERAYKPHITLVRDAVFLPGSGRSKKNWMDCRIEQYPTIPVERFSLISSNLEQGRCRYRDLNTFSLGRYE